MGWPMHQLDRQFCVQIDFNCDTTAWIWDFEGSNMLHDCCCFFLTKSSPIFCCEIWLFYNRVYKSRIRLLLDTPVKKYKINGYYHHFRWRALSVLQMWRLWKVSLSPTIFYQSWGEGVTLLRAVSKPGSELLKKSWGNFTVDIEFWAPCFEWCKGRRNLCLRQL